MQRRFLWLGAVAIAIGVAVLAYRGPARALVRGHAGDIAAAMLVFAVLGALRPRVPAVVRALVTLAIASAIELGQAWWRAESLVAELTIGNTCDPWDLVAYAIGAGLALVWEAIAVRRCAHARARALPRRL